MTVTVGIKAPFAGTLSNLRVSLSPAAEDIDDFWLAATTAKLYINGTAGNASIPIAAILVGGNQYGYYEDTTHTDEVSADDTLQVIFALASGEVSESNAFAYTVNNISFTMEPSACCGSTSADVVATTWTLLGEDSASPQYWSAVEILTLVNDAYQEIARDTGCLEYIEAVQLDDESGDGVLSDFVGPIMRVTWDDKKIEPTTRYALDRDVLDWEAASGIIDRYTISETDSKAIRTYKEWDGTTYNADGLWFNDGEYTYSAWATATAYVAGDRRTNVDSTTSKKWGYACILAHTSGTSTEPGVGTDWTTYWVPLSLVVWAKKVPRTLSNDYPCIDLPAWSHIGIAYLAAAKALGKYGEQRNDALAAVYGQIAEDYKKKLAGIIAQRVPERAWTMGGSSNIRRPKPWERTVVPV